jgi:hypothetical protein
LIETLDTLPGRVEESFWRIVGGGGGGRADEGEVGVGFFVREGGQRDGGEDEDE